MTDQQPEARRALGEVLPGMQDAPHRPTEDEQWHYLAQHLADIRLRLSWIVFLMIAWTTAAICAAVAVASHNSGGF